MAQGEGLPLRHVGFRRRSADVIQGVPLGLILGPYLLKYVQGVKNCPVTRFFF